MGNNGKSIIIMTVSVLVIIFVVMYTRIENRMMDEYAKVDKTPVQVYMIDEHSLSLYTSLDTLSNIKQFILTKGDYSEKCDFSISDDSTYKIVYAGISVDSDDEVNLQGIDKDGEMIFEFRGNVKEKE